jgi:tocopherol O-methyltransferase
VLQPGEACLRPHERALLSKICDAYYLPPWCSIADYQALFGACAA